MAEADPISRSSSRLPGVRSAPDHPRERRAADFLELVERAKRGRLKVFLGYAAGVGKTYRMLEEAQALRRRGVDVVIGLVETHGRPETAALVPGLLAIAGRRFDYRGVTLHELDVEAILARRPEVVVVDEVAHTNVPGSLHRKRYQDVNALLDAGISVLCAFNIQHLESLNELVARATLVQVRETVPDAFLRQADQIVTIDLDIEDLLERLRAGKIYTPDKIDWALGHFFQSSNLATLRELALREVAESVGRPKAAEREEPARREGWGGKLLVCLSSNPPHGRTLLRRGSRLAGRLNTSWYVAHVETSAEAPLRIDAESQRRLLANIDVARELGADVVRLRGEDPVTTLLAFAATHGVSDIVIGRGPSPSFRRLFAPSFTARMLMHASAFDLHIVSFPSPVKGAAEGGRE